MAGQDVLAFGKQLRDFRQGAGLTREALAERAGLSAKAIGALERGERRHPYPHTIRVLADALGLSEDERMTFAVAGTRRETPIPSPAQRMSAGHLPVPPTPLVGRERELAELRAMVQGGARLVTLTGAGGVGKTRLALEVARELAGHFADSTALVSLAPLSDAAFVLPTVAHALGLSEAASQPAREVLRNQLHDRQLLLVLDNLEHVLEAAPEIAALIEMCPRLAMLATSRAPLRLRGEREYPLGPLPVPSLSHVPEVDDLADNPAVALFVERARHVYPDFELTRSNAAAVAAVCRRLDGLPLALELAAARTRVLDPTTMLARLDRVLPVLTGGPRDLPERQRTMEAAIRWSHGLLEPAEQALFRRLSVFAGGWDLQAAAAVGVGEHISDEVLDLLASLVERSLVMVDRGERVRYRMLEPVRQYAMERLGEAGAVEETRRRHAEYYLEFAEQVEPELRLRARGTESLLEAERDNLQEAVTWALSRGQPELTVRLAYALWAFYWERGQYTEVLRWMEEASRAGDQLSPGGRARVRFVAELMRFRLGGNEGLVSA
ncbi:MAG TPA: helix-turn-helix domain-containing protein [Chloroflexota bacterium]|nr:helix-turn-helix domain-containing protein [Chloroflexota bacterium]